MAGRKRADGDAAKLTAMQAAFVREYLIDLNATQAAIRAGYSEKTAEQQGYQLLQKTSVAAAIEAAQEKRSRKAEIDAEWVLRRLVDEGTADMADLFTDGGALRPVAEWPLIWRQGLVAGIEVQQNVVEGVAVGETVKVKLSDRIKRIELIGKHVNVQAFREQVHQTGAISLNVTQEDAEL